MTLSYPLDAQPLMSVSRYVAVLFPLQMWLAYWAGERGRLERTIGDERRAARAVDRAVCALGLRRVSTLPRAFLLDALGTLLELEPPAEPLRRELWERFGVELDAIEASAAVAAEIAFYRANHDVARDRRESGPAAAPLGRGAARRAARARPRAGDRTAHGGAARRAALPPVP